MLNHSLPNAVAPVNPDRVPVRTVELARLRECFSVLRDLAYQSLVADGFNAPLAFWQALGRTEAYVDLVTDTTPEDTPLGLYDPEPEPFEPSPEESQWASENLTPCAVPTTPDGVLHLIADSLESLGLEPTIHPDSIDFDAIGREFRLQLQDMTAYYSHMQREYERFHGLTDGESQALAAGLAL